MVTFGVEQHIARRRAQSSDRRLFVSEQYNSDALLVRGERNGESSKDQLPTTRVSRKATPTKNLRVVHVLDDYASYTASASRFHSRTFGWEATEPASRLPSLSALKGVGLRISASRTYLGMWLPILVASLIVLAYVDAHIQPLRDNFVYPPAHTLSMPSDNQLESLMMAYMATGDSGAGIMNGDASGDTRAVAPPADLSKFQSLKLKSYAVRAGDTISAIAKRFGINEGTLISFNDVSDVRRIQAGATFLIPNKDGLRYTVRRGDTLSEISKHFNVSINSLLDANNLKSSVLRVGQDLFVPGARMNAFQLGLIMGDAFQWPVHGAILTSPFGFRHDPFTGVRDFHNGIDLALYYGAPIHAAGNGTVKDVGYNSIYGEYVIISHPNNFQTLYAHMSKQLAHVGEQVSVGQTIGLMGSTGYSTGTHLHFTIYHNYKPVNPLNYLPKRQ